MGVFDKGGLFAVEKPLEIQLTYYIQYRGRDDWFSLFVFV